MIAPQRNQPAPQLRRAGSTLYRAAAAVLRGHLTGVSPEKVARTLYGKDEQLDILLRAATSPATLTDPAWLGLVGHQVIASQLIQKITALSAAASMIEAGVKVDLAHVASIVIPGRVYDPTGETAGGWIGEGQAIPLRQPGIVPGPVLEPHKLAVLTTYTREMVEADSIEEFTTMAIREAAATLLDLRMFSTTPADADGPGGILIGATSVTPTSVAAPWAISSDIGSLVDALARAGGGLEPVLICAPSQAASLRMWKQEGFFDIFASVALAKGTIIAVERSSFISGLAGLPEFSTSIGSTLHYETTTPTDIVTGGIVATPVKNLFQTDVVGLRMILRAAWAMRNPAHVAIMEGTSW